MDAAAEGNSSNNLPWASVFDPTANMRALSAVQADGFRAASELVDRFVRMASAGLGASGQPAAGASSKAEQQGDLFGATGLEPFVSSWWSMVDQLMRVSNSSPQQSVPVEHPTLDLVTAKASGQLVFDAVPAGSATGEVWLHNGGSEDRGKIRLRCSDLLAHDGTVLAASVLRFEPDVVPMPARSSRGVTAEVDLGEDAAPGTYRGMLVADGQPDVWLPVELVVKPLLP